MRTDDLTAALRERLSLLLEIDPATIALDDTFADLGVDSMMRLELISLVEQNLGFEIPEKELPAMQTIREVLVYVDRHD